MFLVGATPHLGSEHEHVVVSEIKVEASLVFFQVRLKCHGEAVILRGPAS